MYLLSSGVKGLKRCQGTGKGSNGSDPASHSGKRQHGGGFGWNVTEGELAPTLAALYASLRATT